ncbi:MAG: YggS family pyridoxal phosphate-dependent enzyme [Candidatus Portnoybacteria bacterium]|nr:YggS family pyridoxal phosphate-dependent enzyme [Candidatus Portnoybacteria bacterium]
MGSIADNLAKVRERMATAAGRAGRNPDEITLVAVSKTKPAAMIREAFEAGQRAFGENYAQELRDKAQELADLAIQWHFIGSLQRNKVKYVTPIVGMMESIDSKELADALNARAEKRITCLIEVNVGGEDTKSGVEPKDASDLARHILSLSNLDLAGVMAIPPFVADAEESRPYFKKLRDVSEQLRRKIDVPLPHISMGMSFDFEVAIEEGATIVRVGTTVFGERM